MILRTMTTFALLFSLAACDNDTVKTCEQYIRGGLSAPATYKRISVSEATRPITYAELTDMGKDPEMVALAKKMSLPEGPLDTVLITYDASNSFGVPIRSQQVCHFEGEKPIKAMLDTGLSKAERKRDGSCCLY